MTRDEQNEYFQMHFEAIRSQSLNCARIVQRQFPTERLIDLRNYALSGIFRSLHQLSSDVEVPESFYHFSGIAAAIRGAIEMSSHRQVLRPGMTRDNQLLFGNSPELLAMITKDIEDDCSERILKPMNQNHAEYPFSSDFGLGCSGNVDPLSE